MEEILNHYKQALKHRKKFLYKQIERARLFGDSEIVKEHIRSLRAKIGWNTRKINQLTKGGEGA